MFDPAPSNLPTLVEALRVLPCPAPSPGFDDRVLSALRVPMPWWRRLWQPAQPLLLGASRSCALTLLLLHLTVSVPQVAPPLPVSVPTLASAPTPLPSVDALLDRPDLCVGSLAAWNSAPEIAPEQTPRKPEPRRRAAITQRTTLVA